MSVLLAPWLSAAVAVPALAAAALGQTKNRRQVRQIAVASCTASLLFSLEALRELGGTSEKVLTEPWWPSSLPSFFHADLLGVVTMALFALIALVTLVSAPKIDSDDRTTARILVVTAGALAGYSAAGLVVFLAGWLATAIPGRRTGIEPWASGAALAGGVILTLVGGFAVPAFWLLMLAAGIRTGLFPFHRAGATGLASNALMGAFLVVRFAVPLFPKVAEASLPALCILALFTGFYTAVRAMNVTEPRRVLEMVFVSQSSAIFAGLVTGWPEGNMGGRLQWIVLALASTVLFSVVRSVEARIHQPWAEGGFLGLGTGMPRMAVFFAVCALALVGLPGTLGFPGEDLLIHGILAAHPIVGMLLPVSIAINAYHLYRVFSRIFLGAPIARFAGAPDTLPRERWAFMLCLAVLVAGGLVPRHFVTLRSVPQIPVASESR